MQQDELLQLVNDVMARYHGDVRILESAIGALYLGLKVGWKPLLLIHSRATFARYEKILGLNFREVMPAVGPLADKLVGWRLAKGLTNFWEAVRGRSPGRSSEFSAT